MAHFTKLGDLDMRFNSSRSIIARRNFWGNVGSIFLYPLIFPFIFLYYVVIGILKGMRWLFLSVMSLYDALGKKKFLLCIKVMLVFASIISLIIFFSIS